MKVIALCADLTTFVSGRKLEDEGNVLVRLEQGAKGVLYASQVSVGEENALTIRVYGEDRGLEWRQEEPNTLIIKSSDEHRQLRRTGFGPLSDIANLNTRLPPGHPEGFIEAFANVYRNYAMALQSRLAKKETQEEYLDFPTVEDGVRGMAFIEACVKSSISESKWYQLEEKIG